MPPLAPHTTLVRFDPAQHDSPIYVRLRFMRRNPAEKVWHGMTANLLAGVMTCGSAADATDATIHTPECDPQTQVR
jgi:hypothetical protein